MVRSVRLIGWSLAALLPAPLAAPVAASGACLHRIQVFHVRRVGAAPRPIELWVTTDPQSDLATLFVVTVRWQGGRRIVPDDGNHVAVSIENSTHAWPAVYLPSGQVYPVTLPPVATPEEPPDGGLCTLPDADLPPLKMINRTDPTTDEFIVGAYDEDAQVRVSPGWTVTPVSGGAMRMITGNTTGTGVQAGPHHVEHFRGTPDVPGGRWGSVAFAHIPCTELGHPLRSGIGAATLGGGGPLVRGSDRTMTCASTDISSAVGGSSGPTTWYVAGEAIGRTPVNRRLVVFDLPRP